MKRMCLAGAIILLLALPMAESAQPEATPPGDGGPWILENPSITVTLSSDGSFSLLQRSSGARWGSEAPPQPVVKVRRVSARENRRSLESNIEIAGVPWQLMLTLADNAPELDLELSAAPETPLRADLPYPFPVGAPSREYRIVLPHKAGLLFTVEDAAVRKNVPGKYDCYREGGLTMPWVGMTDLERGLMVIFETPVDAGMDVRLKSTGMDRVFAPQVYWRSVRDTAGYTRKLRYCLLDRGGYVAMCKYYRNRLIRKGEFVTLRDKQLVRPQLAKLIGAVYLRLRGNGQDQIEMVKSLESKGVKRTLIDSSASAETLAWMRQQGHLVGAYKIYTDIRAPRPGLDEEHARGYPEDAYTEKDGSPMRGYGYSETRKGTTYRCSSRQLPLMQDLLPPLLRERGYESIFLDVLTALALRECHHAEHALDRRQDQQRRIEILKYTVGLGLVVGSEDGFDWAVPHLHYFEGMAWPRRFGAVSGQQNWPREFDLTEEYIGVALNERVRVPLWDLVFHDSVVTTWHWELGPERYSEAKWWDKHDLLFIIAGNMPIFTIHRQHLETMVDRLAQSYNNVCEWHAKIGWDELVDHRALTDDRSVQESRFSSGWAVAVNFSQEKPYRAGDGAEAIEPFSYRVSRWK